MEKKATYLFGMDGKTTECAADVTELADYFGFGVGDKHLETVLRWLMVRNDADAGCLLRKEHDGPVRVLKILHREQE